MSSASLQQAAQRTASWIDHHSERLLLLGLTVAALLMFTLNLGALPLRDWDEGTVAGVARELSRMPLSQWLYPTLQGEPYFNKPPLVHSLIALTFRAFGVSEWTARLPGALLSGLTVPLLYLVGRELWPGRMTALLGSTVYLASLPVVRHGRLAMLDGASVCFFLVMLLSLLRSRRQPYWSLGAGLGLSLMLLTKGALGLLLGGIGLAFMVWDSPRLLRSIYLWTGLLLGLLPAVGWYLLQGLRYGDAFWMVHLFDQSLDRVWTAVERNQGPPWFYLLELLKGYWPWLLFVPLGLRAAWGDRWRSWGKVLLLWPLAYFAVVSSMGTKLPWYIFPLYPALSLLAGVELQRLWQTISGYSAKLTPTERYGLGLSLGLGVLATGSWAGCVYFIMAEDSMLVVFSLGAIGLTMSAALWRLGQRDPLFVPVLIWGMYLALLLFVASESWVWELAEDYPVKPVAALVQQVPPGATVLTSHPNHRPSLDFYSDRSVIPAADQRRRRQWQRGAYLLLDEAAQQRSWVDRDLILGRAAGWTLLGPPPPSKPAS